MSELAARNGMERADALLRLTQRLTELLTQETQLFRDSRPQDAAALQDEKAKLANIYRAEVARAKQEPTRFSGASEMLKAGLRTATQAFQLAVTENGHAVSAAKVLAEGVVKSIADEAAKQQTVGGAYGPGATQQTTIPGGLSIAINRTA
jgi:hypothetical protein